MNDCPNADVRDLLPDLVHGRLDEATRAMVESHVGSCADCGEELALLMDLRASMERTPALNVAAIAAAVPVYRVPVRRSWVGWRTAAAVTLFVAGGSSVIVMQRVSTHQPDSVIVEDKLIVPSDVAPTVAERSSGAQLTTPSEAPPVVTTGPQEVPKVAPPAPSRAPVERELAMSGGTLTDLSDRELALLLKDIESLDAVPSIDVESVPIAPIAPQRGRP